MVEVLERLGHTLHYPPAVTCCGQPAFNSGFWPEARSVAEGVLDGYKNAEVVVVASGSCAAMLKVFYPQIFEGTPRHGEALALAEKTWEFSDFLVTKLGVTDVAIVGLAKRLEEVWLPGDPDPVILPRTSEGLYLLQRVRDEAHRFAISYQRQKRGKRMVESLLDEVSGLGEARKKALLRQFGSLKRLRAASVEEIATVPGIGPMVAQAVVDALEASAPAPAVNTATGEIID